MCFLLEVFVDAFLCQEVVGFQDVPLRILCSLRCEHENESEFLLMPFVTNSTVRKPRNTPRLPFVGFLLTTPMNPFWEATMIHWIGVAAF